MAHLLTSIISGGAPGAERGALRAAIEMGIDYGGWSYSDDDEETPSIYASRLRPAVSHAMQRRLNVQDSDGTLFVLTANGTPMKFIVDKCKEMRRPAKQLLLHRGKGAHIKTEICEALRSWIVDRRISVLNIVGNAGHDDTRDALRMILRSVPTLRHRSNPSHPGFVAAALAQITADATGEPMNGFEALMALGGREPKAASHSCECQPSAPGAPLNPSPCSDPTCFLRAAPTVAAAVPSIAECWTCGAMPGKSHLCGADDFAATNSACPDCKCDRCVPDQEHQL